MLIFKKEKQVAELVKRHLELTDSCLKKTRETLEDFLAGSTEELEEASLEVNRLESEADSMQRQIRDVLYSGAYLPEIRADIYRLVDRVDKIAGKAEQCAGFLALQKPGIPEEYQADFLELFGVCVACVHELMRAMKTFLKPKGKFEKLQDRSNRVGQLETEADAKEKEITRKIFESELEPAQKLHLLAFVTMIADIADRAENAADELMFAALKSAI